MEGLISPGCVVDVLVTYRPEQDKEPVSETILQNIMVLAVGPYTVASSDQEANLFAQPKNRGESRMVTLAVTPEEAHVLQAAAEKGTVSLALRNPANAVVPEAKRTPDEPAAASAESPPAIAPPRVRPNWVMTVIQGDKKEQHTFPMPGGS
jgi:pilus assembly protein CpaB